MIITAHQQHIKLLQVALILAGQTRSAWISSMRNKAGLTGDKVMPTTKEEMIQLLETKNAPLLALWQNTDMAWRTEPMTYDYPTVTATAPTLAVCTTTTNPGTHPGSKDYTK